MLRVFQDADKVVIDLGAAHRSLGRWDVLLTCSAAATLEHTLREMADAADLAVPTLVRGQTWDLKVLSFDRRVVLRVWPPPGASAGRMPMPPAAARHLADLVRFSRQQAAYGMRFTTRRGLRDHTRN